MPLQNLYALIRNQFPEEFATGFAVADTPPMSLANVGVVVPTKQSAISLLNTLVVFVTLWIVVSLCIIV